MISAPSRLHFGLFSVGGAGALQFGGSGLMIKSPQTVITATQATAFAASGPGHQACHRAIENWFKTMRISLAQTLGIEQLADLPVKLQIESLPPRHSGFGSGTQLALSSVVSVIRLLELPLPSPVELVTAVGRGKRSGIGSHGFFQGGFLIDRGKLPEDPLAPLDFHTDFPEPWSIVTVIHRAAVGLSGDLETNAFADLAKTTQSQRDEMLEIVRSKIMPGVVLSDYDTFADGVYEFGLRSGMMFAGIQNGAYNGPQIESLVNQIRNFGVNAVGQSSWGPCVFAITRDDSDARQLADFLQSEHGDECEIEITKADNQGAKTLIHPPARVR